MGDLGRHSPLLVPVGPIDRMYLGLGGDHPWTVHAEVRVPQSPDRAALSRAGAEAARVHPMLRAHLGADGSSWIVPDLAPAPAVEVLTSDDGPLDGVRDLLVSDLGTMPDGGTVRLAAYDHDDGTATLLAVGHHAAIDGVGIRAALEAWVAAGQGSMGMPDATWQEARRLVGPGVSEARRRETEEHLRGLLAARPVRLARTMSGDASGPLYGVATAPATMPALPCPVAPAATTADMLVASAALALQAHNRAAGSPTTPVVVGVPVNLRRPGGRGTGVGNASMPWPVRIDDEEPAAVVTAVAAQLSAVRAGLLSTPVRAVLAEIRARGDVPLWMRVGLAALTTTVSTMGASTVPWPGREPLPAWGGAPAAPWTGATWACAHAGSELVLSVRHVRSVIAAEDAGASLEGWRAQLAGLAVPAV